MKRTLSFLFVLLMLLVSPTASIAHQRSKESQQAIDFTFKPYVINNDTINPYRIKVSCSTHGVALLNNLDTYLSGYNHHGAGYSYTHENFRNAHFGNYNWKYQTLFSGTIGYADLHDSRQYTLWLNRFWSGYHPFKINSRLQLLAGAQVQLTAGAFYMPVNGNNPVSVKLRTSLAATGMAIYRIPMRTKELTARYQLDIPLIGMAFSPAFGQSYYEIFGLGEYDNTLHLTHPVNSPSWRHTLSLDIPVGKKHSTTLRVAYVADIFQSEINKLRTHMYAHSLSLGIVKTLYKVKTGDRLKKHTPF